MLNTQCRQDLLILWDYLKLDMAPKKAPCIVGFGNYNLDIPLRAAELYLQGYAPKVLFTGGLGRNTLGLLSQSEAERFAETAIRAGVPAQDILLESRSTNTAENINFTRDLLLREGIDCSCLLGVHQPFMERRILAAFGVYWPDIELNITSPCTDLDTFLSHAVRYGITEQAAIEEIIGDFERIHTYAEKGWQLPQEIPADAWDAFHRLVQSGYTNQLSVSK